MSTTISKQLGTDFWKAFSEIFTENTDEKYLDFFFQLQDVFDIKSDSEDGYCKEMASWAKDKQQTFLNDCMSTLDGYNKEKARKLVEQYMK